MIRPALLLCCVLCCLPGAAGAHAQQPQAAVVPEAITVGDVFHAAIRLDLPPGAQLAAPDSLPLPPDLELAGRREVRVDSAGGTRRVTVLYPLTAWRPGEYELPRVPLLIVRDGSESRLDVSLPSFTVRSVLPADTAGIEPKAAKDVLGANRLWWPILLALLLAAVIAGALYVWWRRRRPQAEVAPTVRVLPRAAALAQLEELRGAGLLEQGDVRVFYDRLSEVLRRYAATVNTGWGVDLTTTELSARVRAELPATDALELVRVLGAADLVKFARAQGSPSEARAHLDAAVAWIERVGAEPAAPAEPEQRAA